MITEKPHGIALPGLGLVRKDLEAVERLLERETRSDVKLVMQVSGHILSSGGKRFRPMLTLLSARLVGLRKKRELIAYAAAMEFAHTSTLLHDDVIDEAELRRGQVSANRLFGNAPSVIIGDYLISKSFLLLLADHQLGVMRLISEIALKMAEGEAYQLSQKQRVDLSEAEYDRIIRAKTALLIQAACQVPAVARKAPKKLAAGLADFGYHLGMAFQIVDDVLDYSAGDKKWGKQVGKDFLEGKATLPVILAYHRAAPAEKKQLRRLFKQPAREFGEFKNLLELLDKYHALHLARERAHRHVAAAQQSLAVFPPSPARIALASLADFVVARTV